MSHGGPIAIAYAARHPERVTHLVLYGSFACGRNLDAKSAAKMEENKLIFQLAEMGWEQDNPAYRQMFSTLFIPNASPEHHDAFAEMQRLSMSGANAGRLLREVATFDVRSLAPNVSCPTLVMHSRNDARTSFERGRELAALIPHARFVPLEGRNHILVESEPAWQQFIAEFRAFLPTKAVDGEPHRFSTLSNRERQVLELIAQGQDNHHIAERLYLSEKTVRNHINHIFSKLEVLNRGEAIVCARDAGFGHATGNTGD
jgi:DNA-binding NarL/FixJ family response regulator